MTTKPTTHLREGGVPVDPRAAQYQKDLQARKGGSPVAGGPTPSIPRLDGQHQEGRTMAETAQQQRPSILNAPVQENPAQAIPALLPHDLLPEQARLDPAYIPGTGAQYASAYPDLAKRYGVVRNGEHIPPQKLFAQPTQLRAETLADLKRLSDAQGGKVEEERPERPPMTDEQIKGALQNMDDFDLDQVREMMFRDLFNNDQQKKIVESRLVPLSLADLIMQGYVTQVVPIVPGSYEPEFRSVSGTDDLAIKRLLMEEASTLKVDDRYFLDKYTFMGLACSLNAINKKVLPSHLDQSGNFSPEHFATKFKKVMSYPLPMLASLGVHYFWFDGRVRGLFVAQDVKNG